MKRRGPIFAIGLLCTMLLSSTGPDAAQLVMFDAADCEWCDRWNKEVGIIYAKTDEGKDLPLRRIDIHGRRPTELKWIDRIVYTPTFVLIDQGQEVGRINGYPGEDHFWGLLGVLIKKWRNVSGSRAHKCSAAC